jgi:hypothetical protein
MERGRRGMTWTHANQRLRRPLSSRPRLASTCVSRCDFDMCHSFTSFVSLKQCSSINQKKKKERSQSEFPLNTTADVLTKGTFTVANLSLLRPLIIPLFSKHTRELFQRAPSHGRPAVVAQGARGQGAMGVRDYGRQVSILSQSTGTDAMRERNTGRCCGWKTRSS